MEDSTLTELKESKHRSPEITDVIYDFNQLEELTLDSVNVVEKGFDTVWDKTMFNYHFTYLQDGFKLLEKLIEERYLRVRLIVDATAENIEQINSIKSYDIRHLDNVRGNFGILDGRTYMIYFFNKDTEKPEQGFFSNSRNQDEIRVMTVCPGEVATKMQEDVDRSCYESNKHKMLKPRTVAEKIADMIFKD